jgi:hypothetical protein
MSQQFGTNIFAANWFTPQTFGNATNTLPATTVPTGLSQESLYYQFGCMDRADDYIARIRVIVRSWDETSDFTAQFNPYNPGANEPGFGSTYHDRAVWDDTSGGNGFPGYPD